MIEIKQRRVLMVVFEFPPSNGASVQRILSVYKGYLNAGYIVDVLTAHPFAYENVQPMSPDLLPENPHGKIMRVPALDALLQISVKGKHIGSLAYPDRWGKTWIPLSTVKAFIYSKKNKPDIIWSSSPTPSPHIIARRIKKMTGAKWIADYRDPMTHLQRTTPDALGKILAKVDDNVMRDADLLTFATEDVRQMYLDRTNRHVDDFKTMPNGYDAELLNKVRQGISSKLDGSRPKNPSAFTMYYAGVLYSDGRDPTPLFEALSEFKTNYPDKPIQVVFQGTKNASDYDEVIQELDIGDVVRFLPGVPFAEAIGNMLLSDMLLLIQDARFNRQIPGKLYEYLATKKSIMLKSPNNSATSVEAAPFDGVYQVEDKASIYHTLCAIVIPFFEQKSAGYLPEDYTLWKRDTEYHSRQHHVEKLIAWSESLRAV
ncbi:hypothetical protein BM525_21300 (plasmid) [Alteromonas mediterranea]|uniref:Glycosyltransferase subfamily 4-like N-terminal domain-containing protein n=1 Tax=Alteromonas mediterranea TaxID=314275 RepID=A0AAC9JFX3_9ALTE|nr:hypothetical protein [Alteromonas mediterranea]APD92397.1 hypothetical protein BM524_21080 [Alteromonas mediterranea]APE00258.1 hypothetical protein BM525_21300 [Alteromonas mediterranea]